MTDPPEPTEAVAAARARWRHTGAERPDFAEVPGPGQESVWDYPRPPRLVPDARAVVVRVGEATLAETTRAVRVLETAGAPTFYVPPGDVRSDWLEPGRGRSFCEWKGEAAWWDVRVDGRLLEGVVWSYPDPFRPFAPIAGFLSFHPAHLACFVAGERARPQAGGFYAGWITSELAGPIKGGPGTAHW